MPYLHDGKPDLWVLLDLLMRPGSSCRYFALRALEEAHRVARSLVTGTKAWASRLVLAATPAAQPFVRNVLTLLQTCMPRPIPLFLFLSAPPLPGRSP